MVRRRVRFDPMKANRVGPGSVRTILSRVCLVRPAWVCVRLTPCLSRGWLCVRLSSSLSRVTSMGVRTIPIFLFVSCGQHGCAYDSLPVCLVWPAWVCTIVSLFVSCGQHGCVYDSLPVCLTLSAIQAGILS